MFKTIVSAVLLFAFSRIAAAQIDLLDIDLGLRGGTLNSGIPMEVGNNHYFPDLYSTEKLPFTFGPALGVLLKDRWNLRFEAVRSRFRFHDQSGTPFPASLYKYTSTTDGHVWQYPLLLTYYVNSGGVRAFGGGGISFGSTFGGTTWTETTKVVLPPPGNPNAPTTTVTTFSTTPFTPLNFGLNPKTLYITGGIDSRIKFLSIRPELRYARWTNFQCSYTNCQEDTILFSPNQLEFLVGITVHTLKIRSEHQH
jgi:hypothetical protein